MAPIVSTESGCRAEADAERETGLVARFGGLEEGVERPALGVGRLPGRIEGLHVDAGVLLHQVDARAWSLDIGTRSRGHGKPMSIRITQILDRLVDGAVLLDQRLHDVVDRRQVLCVLVRPPCAQRQNVMPDFDCDSMAAVISSFSP